MARRANELGETLVEVLIAVVLIGAITSGYFYAASSQRQTALINKELIAADSVARSYAELAKSAVRNGCTGNPFTVPGFTAPPNYTISTISGGTETRTCPTSATNNVQTVVLTVATPNGAKAKLSFDVRTP
jgi:type II secretory pathway pseudopilin PulG